MAKPIIAIQFPSPAKPEMMHRALNFMEDVFRFAQDRDIASVSDIDHYGAGQFIVKISASRHLGKMQCEIFKLLREHMLEGDAVVSRLDRAKVPDARDV
jgi:hypothetical protein